MKDGTIKYKTPLTYYGGKQRIASWIVDHIPEHRIYCEPFFGGGAVFFAKEPSYLEVINDLNDNLINFYLQMQKNFKELAAEIGSETAKQYRAAGVTALLGPQVAFERRLHEPKFKEAGVPFDVIPMQWYGMVRGDLVMQRALDMIAEAKGE